MAQTSYFLRNKGGYGKEQMFWVDEKLDDLILLFYITIILFSSYDNCVLDDDSDV